MSENKENDTIREYRLYIVKIHYTDAGTHKKYGDFTRPNIQINNENSETTHKRILIDLKVQQLSYNQIWIHLVYLSLAEDCLPIYLSFL